MKHPAKIAVVWFIFIIIVVIVIVIINSNCTRALVHKYLVIHEMYSCY